ncbi:MAG: outer membrane protein transport protein [Gammaproteobacteria bacterium]|nr:outer membrane protein transport protein [Gammaproteobacteria bacterium]
MKKFKLRALSYAALLIPIVSFANYRVPSENVELLEDAMSGSAAIAIDASTNFFNPAGLTRLPKPQVLAAGRISRIDSMFSGTSVGMSGTARSKINGIIPAMHYAMPVYANTFFGLSVTSPFGSITEYPNDSVLRFISTRSLLQVIDIGPSLAYRFNRHFSLGAGPDAQHGRIVANSFFPPSPFVPSSPLRSWGDDWAFGWHAGALYEFNDFTRLGVNYRSQVRHRFEGQSSYLGVPNNNNLNITLPLPAITSLSLYHAFNATWAMMATMDYTQWDIVKNIVARNSAVASILVVPQNLHNTIRYALGGEYHYQSQWIFRTGLSYDPTPQNGRDRNVTLPVGNSIIFGIGGHYQWKPTLGMDLGYVHVFAKNAPINNTLLGLTTVGNVHTSINVVGMSVTWDLA